MSMDTIAQFFMLYKSKLNIRFHFSFHKKILFILDAYPIRVYNRFMLEATNKKRNNSTTTIYSKNQEDTFHE